MACKNKLEDYIKIYKNFIDKPTCEKIINEINQASWEQHAFYNHRENIHTKISGDKELDICFAQINLGELLVQKTNEVINLYVTKDSIATDIYFCIEQFSSIRFNRYQKGKTMAKHFDHIHSLFDGTKRGIPILSIIGLLNDNYEGGEFIMFDDMKIDLKQGDIMIFPSCFLYPHKVEEITDGTRYSFVSWAW
jgi:predicted 2-oxoglutarate/Fe(II)-dependent dioxygenase YbiX